MTNLPTRLRQNSTIRNLVQETQLTLNDLIQPIFVTGNSEKSEIKSMPGQFYIPLNKVTEEIQFIVDAGIKAIIIFGIPLKKDETGSDTINENGIVQLAVKYIKKSFPKLLVITDVCFCQYTKHGHCGVLNNEGHIDRKNSLELLQVQALSHVKAGADIVAPSCMIDEMVLYIRKVLDENGYENIPILSYSVKYASSFYGPFRDVVESSPKSGNRKSYQMNPGNSKEAIKEVKLDMLEGVDLVMVKPALPYLDVIQNIKNTVNCPVVAYQVSGEYVMIKSASNNGWLKEEDVVLETLTSIKRAGADLIITYFAKQIAPLIRKNNQ
jgi:porphobilinogen synthase